MPNSFHKQWKPKNMECFKKVNLTISQGVMLKYPDTNKPYLIQNDTSNYQLGTLVYQYKPPVELFPPILTPVQPRYPLSDK